ncbi:Eco57I restriction-modification methylase domain-containing protein [Ornithinimicrobium kibberense]|uniref:Eco57I restriction-modification methylase domain-containing protein n=1 Tax=Ornithinimicrobium kibberense TaxID=282060 RepID=A0ABV5V6L2_9MICO|nr:Eco57I restriction-modification methylase domain-containing protein [Ornithinimicrobium kibberense]
MSKKFDVVIGNPPYQADLVGDNENKAPPIYDKFMDAAFEVSVQTVLITPGRFLSNAGQTPKSWNRKVLTDEHLKVALFEPSSATVFPGTDIKGGIVVTHRDETRVIGPIGTLAYMPEVQSIVNSVQALGEDSLATVITEHPCKWTNQVFIDHPELQTRIPAKSGTRLKTNTFDRMREVCMETMPDDGHEYLGILGLLGPRNRATRWIRRDYLIAPPVVDAHKVVVAAANGSGKFGEVLAGPVTMGPATGVTQTFICIGAYDTELEAVSCLKYVKSKFARAMLGVLKTTQHNPAIKWNLVPLQDFTDASDIDWTKPIPDIDRQLYAKYALNAEEIAFIEEKVKPMS